jgi:hypothetical protein
MTTLAIVEQDTYRVIITRRNASEILTLSAEAGVQLPTIQINSGRRVAEQLTEVLQQQFELQTYCLYVVANEPGAENKNRVRQAVMVAVSDNDVCFSGMKWTPSAFFSGDSNGESEDALHVRRALSEIDSFSNTIPLGPFARPGWLKEVLGWTESQIAPLGLRPTGNFKQFNACATFSLLRIETTGPSFWFKASGAPNKHELPISVALSRLVPNHVPSVIGIHSGWNAWLSRELLGAPLNELSNERDWQRSAETLAHLQISTIGSTSDLIDVGCRDLRLTNLTGQIDPFLSRMMELMGSQEKRSPTPLDEKQIAQLRNVLEQAISDIREIGLPDALVHMDLNPGNILVSRQCCSFLDWAEGAVSNPLLSFEYLAEHFNRRGVRNEHEKLTLAEFYLRPWQSYLSPQELRRAVRISPLVAAFAYAVRTLDWKTKDSYKNKQFAGYFRALTRRMNAEACKLADSGVECPH